MLRTRFAAAALALGLFLAGAVPAQAEEAPGEIAWSLAPATAEGVADNRVSYRLNVQPGAEVTEHAILTNLSAVPVTFGVAGADGVVAEDGSFDVLPPNEESVDVGSWISIADTVELAAGASTLIPFTIAVPDNATPGDHPGGIVASVTQVGETEDGLGVGVTSRVGIRVHLRVAGELAPSLSFSDVTTSYEYSLNPFAPGRLHVSYTLENVGNVRVGSIQQASVTGPFGLPTGAEGPSGSVIAQQREVLPGQETSESVVLENVWPLALLTLALSGTHETVGDDVPIGQVAREQADAAVWAIPWPQLIVLAAVVLLVLAALRMRAVRRRRHEAALARAREEGARAAASAGASTASTAAPQ